MHSSLHTMNSVEKVNKSSSRNWNSSDWRSCASALYVLPHSTGGGRSMHSKELADVLERSAAEGGGFFFDLPGCLLHQATSAMPSERHGR